MTLDRAAADAILAEVKANAAKLRGCKAHRFTPVKPKLGQKYTCLHCGGRMSGSELLFYIEGYAAAGGNLDDIWPGWPG